MLTGWHLLKYFFLFLLYGLVKLICVVKEFGNCVEVCYGRKLREVETYWKNFLTIFIEL